MEVKKRVMTNSPLNAEPPIEMLRSWITPNKAFFNRNQGAIPETPVSLDDWRLVVTGEVSRDLELRFEDILEMPKITSANTLECSGNGRSLLKEKAPGNPWTIGGVGNAVWGGISLADVLNMAGLTEKSKHVAFEGFGKPVGGSGIDFIRSIPIEKALESTILAYEMNGEPIPNEHGFPLRSLPLGWYGANSVKWLNRIVLLEHPFEGYFMDKAYRIFQKGQEPSTGKVVTDIDVKAIITKPLKGDVVKNGRVLISGAAYAGTRDIASVEVSLDNGISWQRADITGPIEKYAWCQWHYIWDCNESGTYTVHARAVDSEGNTQPVEGQWNAHGYCNNGIRDYSVTFEVR